MRATPGGRSAPRARGSSAVLSARWSWPEVSAPQARGSSDGELGGRGDPGVGPALAGVLRCAAHFGNPLRPVGPACAGILRWRAAARASWRGRLALAGDPPAPCAPPSARWVPAPRSQGPSSLGCLADVFRAIGPALAGSSGTLARGRRHTERRPRARRDRPRSRCGWPAIRCTCGGESWWVRAVVSVLGSAAGPESHRRDTGRPAGMTAGQQVLAPRLRGSSGRGAARVVGGAVGPAPAGILRPGGCSRGRWSSWPRACGDPPGQRLNSSSFVELAPRLRGSSGPRQRLAGRG
ncbi:hypothetical protein STTU_p0101 (plasmid) [Streptomyces sp. Tu6071]|nr:hypothetical protein STTU_p0101 [Streptomyces sp. Tu6071]